MQDHTRFRDALDAYKVATGDYEPDHPAEVLREELNGALSYLDKHQDHAGAARLAELRFLEHKAAWQMDPVLRDGIDALRLKRNCLHAARLVHGTPDLRSNQ